jgi:hypothetical protein
MRPHRSQGLKEKAYASKVTWLKQMKQEMSEDAENISVYSRHDKEHVVRAEL